MNKAARLHAGRCNRPCLSTCPLLTHRHRSLAVAASSTSAVSSDATAAYNALCDLIRASGGFVHLALQYNPTTGGIVAARDIQQLKGSLVELPLSLRLTTTAAQELLLPALNAAGLPTMSLLDEDQQLALAVAWLRNQGLEAEHTWLPYVHSMSQQTPCGWAKSPQQLADDYENYLHQHGLDMSWWRYFVAQVQQQMKESAEKLAVRFGQALGVTSADVLWALGQVQARKVVVDNEVLLEPWSDLLRHPPAQPTPSTNSSSSRCEIQWTYGLCRNATSVVSRGAGKRVSIEQRVISSTSSQTQTAQPPTTQEGTAVQLATGEELWASSSSSSSSDSSSGDLWSSFIEQQGHLAPLVWYLQHGVVPEGLAAVNMRTSDILESWRRTVASESAGSSSVSACASSSRSSSKGTVLWDYLTQQYQQDALSVLAATPAEHQELLLQFLLQPVAAGASSTKMTSVTDAAITADVDPLPFIEALDELLIDAIDAAEAAEAESA